MEPFEYVIGPPKYKNGTIESILEDRLADLLHHRTIEQDEFIPCIMSDLQTDLGMKPEAGPELVIAARFALADQWGTPIPAQWDRAEGLSAALATAGINDPMAALTPGRKEPHHA